jgi:hypothetical protein
MVTPFAGGEVSEYLALVARDRPEATTLDSVFARM